MESLLLDVRHALRALGRRPAFTALSVVTLAIGIGVNVIAFAAVNALIFKSLDIPEAARTGWVLLREPGNPYGAVSKPDFEAIRRASSSLEAVEAEGRLPVSVRLGGQSDQGWALMISAGYMDLMAARPSAGRLFREVDLDGTEVPGLVSERFWKDRLGGGPLMDQRLIVNGADVTIVGVLPEGFQGPGGLYEPELWLPLDRLGVLNTSASLARQDQPWLTVVARARPGSSPAAIDGELSAIVREAARDAGRQDRSAHWYAMSEPHPQVRGFARLAWIALGVVSIVLLIACFNVASLLLARASERQADIDIRAALGATRGRLVRQLVIEATLTAAVAGAASLILAFWSASLLAAFSLPAPIPQRLHIGVDARLIAYTALLVIAGGLVPALLPALRATRADLFRSMRLAPGGRARAGTRHAFVIAQVAGSTLFLATALLFVRSFTNLSAFSPGFDAPSVLVAELDPTTYGYDAARSRRFFDRLQERIRQAPGVDQVAIADRVPFYVGFTRTTPVAAGDEDCKAARCPEATVYAAGPGHFAALGISLRAGRDFAAGDAGRDDLVILSERAAALFSPGESALGRTIRLGPEGRRVQVIGVVADITHRNPDEPAQTCVYRPLAEGDFTGSIAVVVRAAADPGALTTAVREAIHAIDPVLPAPRPQTMLERMEMPLWPVRTLAGLLVACGLLALALATVGLFGVTHFAVARRTREFGVRIALGASRRAMLSLVLREGAGLSLAGVLLGLAAAFVAGRVLSAALFGVSPADPLAFGATAGIQATVALVACLIPAWRATRTDPIAALRHD